MSRRTVTIFWDVHAWVGVVIALVLATMFFAGSLTVFHHELEAWQDPPTARGTVASLDAAVARLDATALAGKPLAGAPPSDHAPRAVLYLPGGPQVIDPVTGETAAPRSGVGRLFFHLHFFWHEAFPAGMVIAGVFGTLLLLILVTGLVIHLKDLRRQAFRFRPHLRPRYAWSDLHKVLGVWGLPFQLTVAFTGAVICLAPVLGPLLSGPAFDGDRGRGERELYGTPAPPASPPDETPAPTLGFAALADRAVAALPGMEPTYIAIDRWGRRGAQARVWGDLHRDGSFYPGVHLVLDATDGTVRSRSTDAAAPPARAMEVVYGLHYATYGGLGLRLLYLVLGLCGWLTILSGNWIWIERRTARSASRANRILAKLTLGIGGGIVIATAAVLWTNRLAASSADRAGLELWAFFGTWALAALTSLAVPPTRRAWGSVLGAAGAGLVAVPLLSMLVSPAHLGNGGGAMGWRAAGVDVGLALGGLALLLAARIAWRRGAPTAAAEPEPAADPAPSELEEALS